MGATKKILRLENILTICLSVNQYLPHNLDYKQKNTSYLT